MNVSSFLNQIIEAAETEGIETDGTIEILRYNRCQMCNCRISDNETYCSDCLLAISRRYQISELTGRCRSGSDRTGTRWHARIIDDNIPNHKALCGYTPKGLSAGWGTWKSVERKVTCPRCLKKLNNI